MSQQIKDETKVILLFGKSFIKWLFISCVIGAISGIVGSAFRFAVEFATETRQSLPWLIWLLPVGGLIIVFLYKLNKTENEGTNDILRSIHAGEKIPALLVPSIFAGTFITHLLGGSAGREGAALQIGGGIGCTTARLLKVDEKEMRIAVMSGMSALFSALFGTPVTATVFALEVSSVGIIHYSGLVPCGVSSLIAYGVTRLFGLAPEHYVLSNIPTEPFMLVRIAVLAAACAIVSVLFCETMHFTEKGVRMLLPNSYLRVFIGGLLVIALTFLSGTRDYNGGGMNIIQAAVEEGSARPEAFILKIIFTAVTLSFGFKGGEVVPTFFIGATFGCVIGPLIGINSSIAAAIGLVATFCGAVNCPLASIIMSVELFGADNFIYFAIACFISYMLSGYTSLYEEQKIVYSKLKAEYININAK